MKFVQSWTSFHCKKRIVSLLWKKINFSLLFMFNLEMVMVFFCVCWWDNEQSKFPATVLCINDQLTLRSHEALFSCLTQCTIKFSIRCIYLTFLCDKKAMSENIESTGWYRKPVGGTGRMADVLCFNTAPVTSEVVDRPCQPLQRNRHKQGLFIHNKFQS